MTMTITGTDEDLDDGTSYLHVAADLWSLVDERRARAIRQWLDDNWSASDEDAEKKVYDVASLRRVLGLLDGLDGALMAEIADEHLRVDTLTAERLSAQHPTLVDSWPDGGGRVFTLANRAHEVRQVRSLIQRAVDLNRTIEVT